ncbi:hypothetical protein IV203_003816 [Nitzschia inconspicua]|uniref:Uncharacterized protein n=1 Tax=Nitzschia inconspicua TaxID=303405 RepID=A0A9K3PNW2_9STRA|nr:hypothetical protein IV203_003816 [Nitzschia inconspicua]
MMRKLGLLGAVLFVLFSPVTAQQNRTLLSVEFEYRLEVNSTSSDTLAARNEVTSWLSTIDSDIIPSLQERLPNGQAISKDGLPNVQFIQATSQPINQCFTASNVCNWIRTTIELTYDGPKPKLSMERVTLGLVQDFLQDFSGETSMIRASYTYPMLAFGSGRFQLGPVRQTMDATEIEVFESSFFNVFAAIVMALDGDTEVTEARFIYQDVTDKQLEGEELSKVLSVDVMYFGRCRYCTMVQFVDIVEGVIRDPMTLEAFQNRLRYDGATSNTEYFDDIVFARYMERSMPEELPGTSDESLHDSVATTASRQLPWYLWFAVVLVAVILCVGVYCIYKDQQELLKEDNVSTDEDDSKSASASASGYEEEEFTNNRSSVEDSQDILEEDYTSQEYTAGDPEVVTQYGPAESTVVSYNEEPPTAHGKQTQEYEIYVY